jgi:hypothetical protein
VESETFHKGFGDFALKSSDGVVFYISQFLLAYTSPVFKDMFALGPNSNTLTGGSTAQEATSTLDPLQLTEDAETLDLLFRHIDPTLSNPPLDKNSIGKLLEATRKYQILGVAAWFEAEATKKIKHPNENLYGDSFLAQNPMLALSLAAEHNLTDLCREAIRQRVGLGPIKQDEEDIPPELLRRIIILKEERMGKYMNVIVHIMDSVMLTETEQAGSRRTEAERSIPLFCESCGYSFGRWIFDFMTTLQSHLNWETFERVCESEDWSCPYGGECQNWAAKARYGVDELIKVMKEEESKLPDLK